MQIQGVMVRAEHPRPLTAGRSCEGIDERDKSAQFPDEPINHDMRVAAPPSEPSYRRRAREKQVKSGIRWQGVSCK